MDRAVMGDARVKRRAMIYPVLSELEGRIPVCPKIAQPGVELGVTVMDGEGESVASIVSVSVGVAAQRKELGIPRISKRK